MKWHGKIDFFDRPLYDSEGLITVSEVSTVSGSLQTDIDTKSDISHLHDDRYYIEAEVDTISGSLDTKINSKDNYSSWSFAVDGSTKDLVTSGDVLDFVGGNNITITRSAEDQITISGAEDASTTNKGIIEIATTAEINTGTDISRAITPDTFAGSNFGTKNVVVKCIVDDSTLTSGTGKAHFTVPIELDGMNLVSVGAHVYTTSTSGLPSFQIYNATDSVDMLSTVITIDVSEKDSKDAVVSSVINTSNDDVATGDELRFDCDVAGTGTKGMEIRTGFRLP